MSAVYGADYDETHDRILVWLEGATVYSLTPPSGGNRITGSWTLNTLATNVGGGVIPSAQAGNGTFGRFFVSKKNNAAYGFNQVNEKLFCLPLE